MSLFAFEFVHKYQPDFYYFGEVVVDTVYVSWVSQFDEAFGVSLPGSVKPVEYSVKEMEECFRDGTWIVVER